MTYQILKSSIAAARIVDFAAAVDRHIGYLREWQAREDIVSKQDPLPPQPKLGDFLNKTDPESLAATQSFLGENRKWYIANRDRYIGFPRPAAHTYVEAAVREDAGQFIADFEIVNDDPTSDQILRSKKNALLVKISKVESAATELVLGPPGKRRLLALKTHDILQTDSSHRTPADAEHLAAQASRQTKIEAIARASAQAMSDVEDLTLENVDGHQVPILIPEKGLRDEGGPDVEAG